MLNLINKVVSWVTGTKQTNQEFVCEEPDEPPYRIPTLEEVESSKEEERRLGEERFQKMVVKGVRGICNQLREGKTQFVVNTSSVYSLEVVFCYYYNSPEFIEEVNKRLKAEGWEVSVSVEEGAYSPTVSVNIRYIGKE